MAASQRRFLAVLGAAILLVAVVATASGATNHISLLVSGASGTDTNGGLWVQGGTGSGTGNFDPYLTYGSNTGSETGLNVCDDVGCPDPQFDTTAVSAGRTHELLASAIPVVTRSGVEYREFSLDANDTGAEDYMSIDALEIYLSTDKNLGDYPFDSGEATEIYSLPADTDVLMRSQTLTPGSGVSDLTLLVPSGLFGPDCYYGSLTCQDYVFFYVESGGAGTVNGNDYDTTGGFEEWRVALQPVVNVSKTVTASVERTYPWDVTKTANVDSIDLFAGDTASIDWSVTATASEPTDANLAISGTISITNPTGGEVISEPIPATINSVTDLLSQGAVDTNLTVSCPVSLPYTLPAGATLNCTYSGTPPSADSGTNTATANINIATGQTVNYSGSAAVTFGVDEIDECVSVTDDNATPGDTSDDTVLDSELCAGDSPGTYDFSTDVGPFDAEDCASTTITNTAYTLTNDTDTEDSASDLVDVACYQLSVAKDATPTFSRNYTWTIDKSVTPTTINMFDGAPEADVDWSITPHRSAPSDSNYAVTGTITITNPAPIAADDVSVADMLTGAIAATVDCGSGATTVDVPAAAGGTDGEATCSYSTSLPDGASRTNTATATLFGVGYTGTAGVDFSNVSPTTTNDTAQVTDPTVGVDQAAVDGQAIEVDGGATCPADQGEHKNTATVTPDDGGPADTNDATYTVNCYGLTVSKDATTTFSRDYDWSIAKSRFIASGETDGDGNPTTLDLAPGQTFTASYHVVVTQTAHHDSDWAVSGTITVTNDAPIDAEDVVVSDLISPDALVAAVDCDDATTGDQNSVDVAANSSVECSYSAGLTDASARTNVATATLNSVDYDSDSVDVTFDDSPDVKIDECIDVVDNNGTPGDTSDDSDLGTVCLGDLDENGQAILTTTIDIGPYEACTTDQVVNTASFATTDDANDTTETGSSSYTVNVQVPCPEGCTLTQGYWKTHNDSFHGGAPTDETWELLGDVDNDGTVEGEEEDFFLSGQTFFEVMWTAPQGNAYYNLAHQYIAARLNILTGADPSAAQSAIDSATSLFETWTPDHVAKLKGKNGKELRSQFIALAGVLGSYNEGAIGPGHCDEDGSSAPAIFLPIGLLAPLASRLRRRRMA
jgi:hypothetical protein